MATSGGQWCHARGNNDLGVCWRSQGRIWGELQREGLTNLGATKAGVEDLVEKSQQVRQVQPESAVEAACVQPTVEQCVMPLHHHESFALQAVHIRFVSRMPPPPSQPFVRPHGRERSGDVYRVTLQAVKRIVPAQRRRFMMSAMQPASRPPPAIVIAKVKYALALPAGCVSYRRSRTPPCTINTDKVVIDPIQNHQMKVLTLCHPRSQSTPASRALSRHGL